MIVDMADVVAASTLASDIFVKQNAQSQSVCYPSSKTYQELSRGMLLGLYTKTFATSYRPWWRRQMARHIPTRGCQRKSGLNERGDKEIFFKKCISECYDLTETLARLISAGPRRWWILFIEERGQNRPMMVCGLFLSYSPMTLCSLALQVLAWFGGAR